MLHASQGAVARHLPSPWHPVCLFVSICYVYIFSTQTLGLSNPVLSQKWSKLFTLSLALYDLIPVHDLSFIDHERE